MRPCRNATLLVDLAALCGIASFVLLALSVGTDYWYIMDTSGLGEQLEIDKREELGLTHMGLWRTCTVHRGCQSLVNPFSKEVELYSDFQRQIPVLEKVVVIVLPVSLVLMVFGGIFVLISALLNHYYMICFAGIYFIFGASVTLVGVSVYCAYSQLVAHTAQLISPEVLHGISIAFGWSFHLAWLSCALEALAGSLFLLSTCATAGAQDAPRRPSRWSCGAAPHDRAAVEAEGGSERRP
ncbi:transmembrane protein 235-like isoform X1 [Petromyzon marinus]|uniref:Transmembrane protein 114-like isoform X1 n=1 Tax=Petromyzon marinus TaxID=7757 RepID=A0AAJ7U7Y3_PETMA|nr:transmembrane protein 114-like isoform X1 [Petromyzon marinus]